MKKAFFRNILSVLFLILLAGGFAASCKKNGRASELSQNDSVAESAEKTTEEKLYDFYNPYEDDASWVEDLLMRVEEERIAQELASMEESLEEYQMSEEDGSDGSDVSSEAEVSSDSGDASTAPAKNPIEEFLESQQEGKVFSGKNNQLRFYEFNNEILAPHYTDEGLVVVHSADGNVIRNFYDTAFNLIKKEEWKINSASDATILRSEEFAYSPESGKVIQKKISTTDTVESVSYNEASSPVKSQKYIIVEDAQYILMERSLSYDDENRVTKDEQKDYTYKDGDYKKAPVIFAKRYEYKYTDSSDIPPDFKYYENDVLKMQNHYSDVKGNYVSWIYFDENLSVKTYYEDDIRVRDEYYNKRQLFRTKVYEKPRSEETGSEETSPVIKKEAAVK